MVTICIQKRVHFPFVSASAPIFAFAFVHETSRHSQCYTDVNSSPARFVFLAFEQTRNCSLSCFSRELRRLHLGKILTTRRETLSQILILMSMM